MFLELLQSWEGVIANTNVEEEIGMFRSHGNGLYPNMDTAYVFGVLPADTVGKVAVFSFRPPTFEDTYQSIDPFKGGTNVRYWSLCVGSIFTTTTNCLVDDEVSLDPTSNGGASVTVVVAPESLRDAVESAGGLNFLGYGAAFLPIIIHRHMLPDSDYAESIFNVPVIDTLVDFSEEYFDSIRASNVMGVYTPVGQIYSISEFEEWLQERQ